MLRNENKKEKLGKQKTQMCRQNIVQSMPSLTNTD